MMIMMIQMGLYISGLIRYHGYTFVLKRYHKWLFSYIRDSKEAKFQHSRYRPFYVVPRCCVISQPVSGVLSWSHKSRPRKKEASFSRKQTFNGSESNKGLELGKKKLKKKKVVGMSRFVIRKVSINFHLFIHNDK